MIYICSYCGQEFDPEDSNVCIRCGSGYYYEKKDGDFDNQNNEKVEEI